MDECQATLNQMHGPSQKRFFLFARSFDRPVLLRKLAIVQPQDFAVSFQRKDIAHDVVRRQRDVANMRLG